MAGEDDAHQVVGLAFHGLGARIHVEQAVDRWVGLGDLHPDADPLAHGEGQQIDHDLEALGGDALGQGAAGVSEVVDRAEIGAHFEAGTAERRHHAVVRVAAGEGQLVDEAVRQPGHLRQHLVRGCRGGSRGCFAHRGVATRTASGTLGTQPPVACSPTGTELPGRRVISPVRIFSWSVRTACSNVSGDGGHPGA